MTIITTLQTFKDNYEFYLLKLKYQNFTTDSKCNDNKTAFVDSDILVCQTWDVH